ncbi:MAG: phage holin family protein [Actinomycetes bacterium]
MDDERSPDQPTLGQLVAAASADVSALVHAELELAKAELRGSALAAAKSAGMVGAAAFLGIVAFVLLSVAAASGLADAGINHALAFVVVAVVYLLVAVTLGLVARSHLAGTTGPIRAITQAKAFPAALRPASRPR